MSFYEDRILPTCINAACGNKAISRERKKIVPLARGQVLEVGMGSGLNLPFYSPDQVEWVWGLEPSAGMRRKAQKNLEQSAVEVRWLDLPGEAIPLEDQSVDTVLLTFTLCTIPDWQAALKQMHRVLKPGGQLLFCEHGLAPEPAVQRWQNRLNPLWKKLCGGCNINRPTVQALESGGFRITELANDYLPKTPHFVGYISRGQAVLA
ncbi:MAG: class I SAM-dependent methyltransferase [Halioglobus sp.]|nr:class I SAM-dependent methyltransferase [Halioglobus sp.]